MGAALIEMERTVFQNGFAFGFDCVVKKMEVVTGDKNVQLVICARIQDPYDCMIAKNDTVELRTKDDDKPTRVKFTLAVHTVTKRK